MIIISRALLLSVSVLLLITVSISSTTSPPNNHNIKDVSLTNDSSNLEQRKGVLDSINNDSSSDSDDEDSVDKVYTTGNSRKDGVTEHNDTLSGNEDSDLEHDVKDYLAKKTLDRKLKQSVQKPTKPNSNIKRVFGKLSFVRKKQVSYIDVAGFFPEQDDAAPSSSDDESLDYQPEHFKQDKAELQALKYYLLTQIPSTPLPPNDIILSPHSIALRAAVSGLDKSLARLEHEDSRKVYMKLTKDDAAVYMEDIEEWEATPFNNQDDDSSDSDEEDDDMPPPSTDKKRPRSNKLNKKKKRALRKRPRYRGDDYHFRNFPHSFFD